MGDDETRDRMAEALRALDADQFQAFEKVTARSAALDEIIELARTEYLAKTGLLGDRVRRVLREHGLL